jgi:hypothetical protein
MNIRDRINHLKEEHQRLHDEVETFPTSIDLKKQKLAVKDEIQDLEWADMYQGGVESFG